MMFCRPPSTCAWPDWIGKGKQCSRPVLEKIQQSCLINLYLSREVGFGQAHFHAFLGSLKLLDVSNSMRCLALLGSVRSSGSMKVCLDCFFSSCH